jgi:chromosome segregation ATPase
MEVQDKQEELADLESRIEERKAELIGLNNEFIERLSPRAPFYDSLRREYVEGTAALRSEQAALEARRQEILSAMNPRQDEARKKILETKLLEAVAAGDTAAIEERQAGLTALDDEGRSRKAELADIGAQLESIATKDKHAAKTVFDHATLEARRQIRAAIEQCLDTVQDIKAGVVLFSNEHDIGHGELYFTQLTQIGHIGPDRPLRARIVELLG